MKRIIYTILIALFVANNFAQAQQEVGGANKIWSYPVIYNYDEGVTWYFDLSTTTFAVDEEVYIWIWSPSEPDAGNWENSSEFAHLTNEGNMLWSFTFTPTEYFSMTPEDIAASAGFWMRLKDKTGAKQTDVINVSYTAFSSFYTANELIRTYPEAPTLNGGLSILFNSNLVPGFENVPSVHFHSGLNNWSILQEYQAWIPEITEKTKLKDLGNGFYKMDLIPSEYYDNIPDGFVMENITYLMVAADWVANSGDQAINAAEYIPPPPPVFRFFPLQISKKDFLGISRINNEVGINTLYYTINAGTTQITGEFNGGVSEIKGFVNLPSALQGISNINEIHVLVKDNTDRTISDTTIPLKTLD
ncbi:hypothetical protein SAMN05428642_103237 [Flaviramulus basaltis]|uniref:Uncharacterized protein n=1 Tax=Flaviramulus basaltis TaxID=369401 RepID=A0A1K2IPJ6_9FLAO|nr:hypothetical protein [Flaviramulus basaltis]SFZ93619.1 hypothetical protein SAMN05428642_103237 [Flaviramulus basaltis]